MINVRTAKEVAANLVYPDKKEDKNETGKPAKAQNIRYIASVEKTRKKVMKKIYEEVKDENFNNRPLVCVMDGSLYLWALFKDVFKDIENKVLAKEALRAKSKDWDEYWEFFTAQAQNNIFFPDEYNFVNVQEKMAA